MKKDKDFYLSLLIFIGAPIAIVVGALMTQLSNSNRVIALGGLLICLALFFICIWLIRIIGLHSVEKEKKKEREKALAERQNIIDEARQAFKHKTNYPKTNTLKLVNEGIVFSAEGRYVCEKDFKKIPGYHLAFEISTTELKRMPKDYDDVCDFEGTGVIVSVGYHDGEALEKYANDNGVILKDTLENSVDNIITLISDGGYAVSVCTAEGDDIDYGFVKILKYENDILTVHFSLHVPYGLCDTVEGVVELKKDAGGQAHDINYLIGRIKRKPYNTMDVSDEVLQSIKQANPFLPESYIAFLSEVGFADLDWIDIGWNAKTPTNLDDNQIGYINDILKDYNGEKVDDYYFIGIDNSDSYYAFSRNTDDKKVYIFSNDASNIDTYETFEELLSEILTV